MLLLLLRQPSPEMFPSILSTSERSLPIIVLSSSDDPTASVTDRVVVTQE